MYKVLYPQYMEQEGDLKEKTLRVGAVAKLW